MGSKVSKFHEPCIFDTPRLIGSAYKIVVLVICTSLLILWRDVIWPIIFKFYVSLTQEIWNYEEWACLRKFYLGVRLQKAIWDSIILCECAAAALLYWQAEHNIGWDVPRMYATCQTLMSSGWSDWRTCRGLWLLLLYVYAASHTHFFSDHFKRVQGLGNKWKHLWDYD
jgi:hypothetical protein